MEICRFYIKRRIRVDELGQTFVSRLVMRVLYKDGYKKHRSTRRIKLPFVMRLERRTTEGYSPR